MNPSARPRIRTFHARHGRMTPRLDAALAELGPGRSIAARDPDHPLVVEIGSGFGHAALGFADAHPDIDVLAADVHRPGVARLLLELAERPRPNVYVHCGDGVAVLDDHITSSMLAGLHLFFPDPWPKVRQHKRRIVRPDLLDLFADRLRPGATVRFATDHAGYAQDAGRIFGTHPAFSGGPSERPAWRPRTGYEERALAAGRSISELAYRRG